MAIGLKDDVLKVSWKSHTWLRPERLLIVDITSYSYSIKAVNVRMLVCQGHIAEKGEHISEHLSAFFV